MESSKFTRKTFIVRGAAAATVAAVAFDLAPNALATAPPTAQKSGLFAARFGKASGPRDGVVTLLDGSTVPVSLDPEAYVAHGLDGLVDSLATFVPGEEVVVRGGLSGGVVTATELQSMYSGIDGTLALDGAGYVLVTASGQRVSVADDVLRLRLGDTAELGTAYPATIWTDPRTNKAAAVEIGSVA